MAGELLQTYPESKELAQVIGELLAKAGAGEAIQGLIDQIIATTTSKPEGWKRSTEVLCNKLAVFLAATVEDEKKYFARMPDLSSSLATVLKSEKGDVPLLTSIAFVSRRLCDRFENDAKSPYGLKAMTPQLMPALATAIAKDETSQQNRQFLINSYRAMAVFAKNPDTNKTTVDSSESTGLIPVSYNLLKVNSSDPDVAARILEFLAFVSSTHIGVDALLMSYPKVGNQVSGKIKSIIRRVFCKVVAVRCIFYNFLYFSFTASFRATRE